MENFEAFSMSFKKARFVAVKVKVKRLKIFISYKLIYCDIN